MVDSKLNSLIELTQQCRSIAIKIFSSFKEMFPHGISDMLRLSISEEDMNGLTAEAKLDIKIRLTRSKLDELKELEASLHRHASPIPAAPAAAADKIAAPPRDTRQRPCPPFPKEWRNACTDPEHYWNFCYAQLLESSTALGPQALNTKYEEHCRKEGKECGGHQHLVQKLS